MGPRERAPLHEHSLDRVVIYMTDQDFRITPEHKDPNASLIGPAMFQSRAGIRPFANGRPASNASR